MEIEWSPSKNEELKERYGVGFERVLVALTEGALLDSRTHPNVERYGHQHQLIVEIDFMPGLFRLCRRVKWFS